MKPELSDGSASSAKGAPGVEVSRELRELRERLQDADRELAALKASEQRARAVLDTAVDGILTIDGTGRVESMNRAAEEMFGYSASEVVGRNVQMLMPEPSRSVQNGEREHCQETGQRPIVGRGREVSGRRRDGSTFPIELAVSQVDSERQLFTGIIRDITERKQLEAQLTRHALHDPLTGLGNRTLLMERLDQALSRRPRHGGLLALLFLDLDRFKLVNDTLGHEAGDELLMEVGARLMSSVRREDLVVRLGGDEFVLLCEDLVDTAGAEIVAARVVDVLSTPVQLRGREIFVSASVGVVTDTGQRTAAELLRDADAAMYQAKQQGRARYSLVDEVTTAVTTDRLQLSSDLRHVLHRAELRALYQPLVDLRTGEVRAAEALLRWQHPERGLLAPGTFLDIADDIGLTADMDGWMLAAACGDAAQWERSLGRPVGVAVNLSARSLADRRLPEAVAAALEQARLAPALLTLEITEGALMQNAATTVRMLNALRDLGVQLAVDDFGTGYSSLSYLQQFPVQTLKVDRSFVARLDDETQDSAGSRAIVRAVVSLAAGLGLSTVAEGIETPGQLAAVMDLGCDLGQGYFLGRPAPARNIPLVVPDGVVMPGEYSDL